VQSSLARRHEKNRIAVSELQLAASSAIGSRADRLLAIGPAFSAAEEM